MLRHGKTGMEVDEPPAAGDVEMVDTGVTRAQGSVECRMETSLTTTVEDVEAGLLKPVVLSEKWDAKMKERDWATLEARRKEYDQFLLRKMNQTAASSDFPVSAGKWFHEKETEYMGAALFCKDGVPVVDARIFGDYPPHAKRGYTETYFQDDFTARYETNYPPSALVTSFQLIRLLESPVANFTTEERARIVKEFVVDYWQDQVPERFRNLLQRVDLDKAWLTKDDALAVPWIFRMPNPLRNEAPTGDMTPAMWYGILRSKFQPVLIAAKPREKLPAQLEVTVYFQCMACGGICSHTRHVRRKLSWSSWDLGLKAHVDELEIDLEGRDLILDHMATSDPEMIWEPMDSHNHSEQQRDMMQAMSARLGAFGIQETYRRFHHALVACEGFWERYGSRLSAVTGIVPGQGMRHYGLGVKGGNGRQRLYVLPGESKYRAFEGYGCKYPVKSVVYQSIGDVRGLAVLAWRILESNPVRCQIHASDSVEGASKARWNYTLTAKNVLRTRPGLVHWNPSEGHPNYGKSSTLYCAWDTLPATLEDYGALLGVTEEDTRKLDPYAEAHSRIAPRIQGKDKAADPKDVRGLLLPPAAEGCQWYSVVELDLTEEFREKLELGPGIIVVICQDQLVAATDGTLQAKRYEEGSEGPMFEAWALNTSRMKPRMPTDLSPRAGGSAVRERIREAEDAVVGLFGMGYDLVYGLAAGTAK
jgi:hypothetical protein